MNLIVPLFNSGVGIGVLAFYIHGPNVTIIYFALADVLAFLSHLFSTKYCLSSGDAVIIFPPPPPPYFPESSASAVTRSPGAHGLLPNENPPSYYSIFNYG